jgi:hypothetical protein
MVLVLELGTGIYSVSDVMVILQWLECFNYILKFFSASGIVFGAHVIMTRCFKLGTGSS